MIPSKETIFHIQVGQQGVIDVLLFFFFRKNLNASKPSEHPPQVEECLKV